MPAKNKIRTSLPGKMKAENKNSIEFYSKRKNPGQIPMTIGSDKWKQFVLDLAANFGLGLNAEHASIFAHHAIELERWNKRINLTALRDPVQVAIKHFIDSIAPLQELQIGRRVLDLGTGGGFPGLPLKVMRPGIDLVMIDGSGKKISFVKHVIRTLEIARADAFQLRAEQMKSSPRWRESFDTVVCRALGTVNQVVNLALPLMKPGAKLWIWKSDHWQKEEKDWPPDQHSGRFEVKLDGSSLTGGAFSYNLPGGSSKRWIVELIKSD